MSSPERPPLTEVVRLLRLHFPIPAIQTDPLKLILWENIGYLIDDYRRQDLFRAFGEAVGFDPLRIAVADQALLYSIARRGGMRPETRVGRWREIARIVLEDCDGNLDRTLRGLPLGKARALLKRFPTIGDPGADKILLFCDIATRPCLESNGLRALARLGVFEEHPTYTASYKAAIDVLASAGRPDRDWLVGAHLVLRELGKKPCKRGTPICSACPLQEICPRVEVSGL